MKTSYSACLALTASLLALTTAAATPIVGLQGMPVSQTGRVNGVREVGRRRHKWGFVGLS
jgi:hypothetical protein